VIEKFSDFGTKLRFLKYKGSNKTALCHVVVFSNRRCLDALKHRDICEFDVDAYNAFCVSLSIAKVIVANVAPAPFVFKVSWIEIEKIPEIIDQLFIDQSVSIDLDIEIEKILELMDQLLIDPLFVSVSVYC